MSDLIAVAGDKTIVANTVSQKNLELCRAAQCKVNAHPTVLFPVAHLN